MQNSSILITKTSLGKEYAKKAKAQQKTELGKNMNSKFKIYNAVPFDEIHFYDMTRADEVEYKPLPASGADVLAMLQLYNVQEFKTGGDIIDKIETVRVSEFGERYLIINALESDPGLVHEEWLLHNRADLIELGIKAVKKTCYFHRTVIASRYDVKINGTENACFDFGYPIENDQDIVKHALGIELEHGETAATSGVLIIGLQTLINIGLVCSGVEEKTRYMTVANIEAGEYKTVRAPFGSFTVDILTRAFGKQEGMAGYVGAGALSAAPIELQPKVGYETELIAYGKAVQFNSLDKCSLCGECQEACPLDLPVQAALAFSGEGTKEMKRRDAKKFKDIDVDKITKACIGCKACTFACPEGLDPMMELSKIKGGKAKLRVALEK